MAGQHAVRDEHGLSQSVQFAVIWPLLLLVTLGIVQAGLWVHGRDVVQRAALAAADEARGTQGDEATARQLATAVASSGGLSEVDVSVARGAERVDVVVSARAPVLLDLGLARLRETASAPVERVTVP